MTLREATADDFPAIWSIFHDVVSRGDTYAIPTDTDAEGAREFWLTSPRRTYVYDAHGEVLGTYFLKTNQAGPGDHVCNCGYMVVASARGRGIATAMCQHSLAVARELGYQAMQFNCVVASNTGAIRLWQQLGFEIVGTLPRAFRHPREGYVDAHVMYQWLESDAAD